jgi:hypothetical protein
MLKRRHFLLVSLVAVAAAAVPAALVHDGQVVLDDKDWALATLNTLDGTMEVLTDGNSHPPIYQVNVLRPGRGVEDLHLVKPVPSEVLAANPSLVLRFRARAGSQRIIRTALQDPKTEPWAKEVTLTRDWQEFRLPIDQVAHSNGQAVMAFQIGGKSGEVAITDIKLERS